MKKKLYNIAKEDGRYSFEVIKFVNEALGYTIKNFAEDTKQVALQRIVDM